MTRPHERMERLVIIALDDTSRCCLLAVVVDVRGRRVARARDGGAVGTEIVPVVGAEFVGDVLAGAVGVDVIRHVVSLVEHVLAHLVEGGGGDEVALAVDVPGDGAVRGADGVVAGGASGGASVSGDLLTHDGVGGAGTVVGDDHTTEHVGVVVRLVVDNDEDLRLDANLAGEADGVGVVANLAKAKLALARVGLLAEAAEDTVVEGELVLPLGVASTHLGVRPVDLVGLADDHVLAVLPVVVLLLIGGEVGVVRAPAAEVGGATGCSQELAASGLAGVVLRGGGAVGRHRGVGHVVLTGGDVLGAKMPVNVHGAHSSLGEGGGDGLGIGIVSALVVAEGDVTAGLLDSHGDAGLDALEVVETGALAGLLAVAGVLRLDGGGGGVVLIPLRLEHGISNADRGGASDERADDGVAADSGGGGALLLGHDAKLGGDLNDGSHFD
mmetsp:Transcript_12826/g.50118  ORF Transcript_12826/g.50118 Transcript_12826/m.50118 type:complete len:442 (+) Transcript_12826:1725-3050(+)